MGAIKVREASVCSGTELIAEHASGVAAATPVQRAVGECTTSGGCCVIDGLGKGVRGSQFNSMRCSMVQRYLQRVVRGLAAGLIEAKLERIGAHALVGSTERCVLRGICCDDFTCHSVSNGMVSARNPRLVHSQLAKQAYSARTHIGNLQSRVASDLVLNAGIEVLKIRRTVVAVHRVAAQGVARHERR